MYSITGSSGSNKAVVGKGDMDVPEEYRDREQTWFKHHVLQHYLRSWSQKLASLSQRGQRIRLWYVDCFSGPWKSQDEKHADTSVAIGLNALEEALARWTGGSGQVEAGAIFVEAKVRSAKALETFVNGRENRGVQPKVLQGTFEERVAEIQTIIGDDPAFIFVDPTGWKGAGMGNIAPLVAHRFRDVMVNVMFHHINRWKDDPRDFLRQQMRELFGLGDSDLPAHLTEEALMSLYRKQLATQTKLPYVADLAVPHPTVDRTFFRLVVGGHHPEVLNLFRDIEEKVVGRDAGVVRDIAKSRARQKRSGQTEISYGIIPTIDVRYQRMRDEDLVKAIDIIRDRVSKRGPVKFGEIWPAILADHHVTRRVLGDAILKEVAKARLSIVGMQPGERSLKNEHAIGPPAPRLAGI
jgi:three-Cys-motif partner protein